MKIVNQLPLSLLLPSAVSSLLKRLKDIAEKRNYFPSSGSVVLTVKATQSWRKSAIELTSCGIIFEVLGTKFMLQLLDPANTKLDVQSHTYLLNNGFFKEVQANNQKNTH